MTADSNRVLTIEGAGHSELQQRCRDWGFAAVGTQSMWTAVSAFRTQDFSAVVIDLETITDDILELVLNLRDINNVVPILVLGEPTDEQLKRALQNRTKVYLLVDRQDDELRAHTARVMEHQSRQDRK